jgi:hypothetical protein
MMILAAEPDGTAARPILIRSTSASTGFNDRIRRDAMSATGVRRDKAALFQWVQIPPGECSSRKQSGAVMEVTK